MFSCQPYGRACRWVGQGEDGALRRAMRRHGNLAKTVVNYLKRLQPLDHPWPAQGRGLVMPNKANPHMVSRSAPLPIAAAVSRVDGNSPVQGLQPAGGRRGDQAAAGCCGVVPRALRHLSAGRFRRSVADGQRHFGHCRRKFRLCAGVGHAVDPSGLSSFGKRPLSIANLRRRSCLAGWRCKAGRLDFPGR